MNATPKYKSAVTFGRFNIPHKGHVELVAKMLQVADYAVVAVSGGAKNNDWDLRVLMFRALLRRSNVDPSRVRFVNQANPFAAIDCAAQNAPFQETVLVLGEDQEAMAKQLSDACDVPFILNVRSTSSTSVRENMDKVDSIFQDRYVARLARVLRFEEVTRESQAKARRGVRKAPQSQVA
jgi:cytidyltransferase-like protein